MTKEKAALADVVELSRRISRGYFSGDMESWFCHLCPQSVWVGTGEPFLVGDAAIRSHFQRFAESGKANIYHEEYYPVYLSRDAAIVYENLVVGREELDYRSTVQCTLGYRLLSGETKLVYQHHSYGFSRNQDDVPGTSLQMDTATFQFVRSILMDRAEQPHPRIPISTGGQVLYVDPLTMLYIKSRRKWTDIVCIDRVIPCSTPIHELSKQLPPEFYQIHRSYLVNTRYVTALRRCEVELISGITLPVPAVTYMQVKEELNRLMCGG